MNTPVIPTFSIYRLGVRGSSFHGHVCMMQRSYPRNRMVNHDEIHVEPLWKGRSKLSINAPGHINKMAGKPIYGRNL